VATIIYLLCSATAFACAFMLLRTYRRSRHRILLWSGLCFVGMFLNNLLLMVDRLILLDMDLSTLRLSFALVALLPLLYGLVWEDD
jgi:hypothetical protein